VDFEKRILEFTTEIEKGTSSKLEASTYIKKQVGKINATAVGFSSVKDGIGCPLNTR
jgi:hypothetical protein